MPFPRPALLDGGPADEFDVPTIDLSRAGPSVAEWDPVTTALPLLQLPPLQRLVVVAPHPDDETFAAGGLIALVASTGTPVAVVSVSDGEAAAPIPDLVEIRRDELVASLRELGGGHPVEIIRLQLPDGAVNPDEVERALRAVLAIGDLVVCPLSDDGHPDHTATAIGTIAAAGRRVLDVWQAPIWAWHSHRPERSSIRSGGVLPLDEQSLARKRSAISCFPSQLEGHSPVVPATVRRMFERPFEVYVAGAGPR